MTTASDALRKTGLGLFGAFLIFTYAGCTANFAPSYDPQTASQITDTYKAVTQFYVKLQSVPENKRTYRQFADGYADVVVQMETLLWRAENQAHNKQTTEMAKHLLHDWKQIQVRQEHRDSYSDALASIDQKRLDDLLDDMATIESFKQKPSH